MPSDSFKDPPIIVSDEVIDKIQRVYLLDLKNVEIPVCDCIYYDLNGNPNCSIHKGRLQEFRDEGFNILVSPTMTAHLEYEDKTYCHTRISKLTRSKWIKGKGIVTCSKCLKKELKNRKMIFELLSVRKESLDVKLPEGNWKIRDLK